MSDSRDTSLPYCGADKFRLFDKFRINQDVEEVRVIAYKPFTDAVYVTCESRNFYIFFREGLVEKSIRNGAAREVV